MIPPGAKYVFLALTGQGGSALQSRRQADGPSASADGPEAKPPHWLKFTRSGDVFSGYISADGTNWIAAGSVTNALSNKLSVGLAVTAHNNQRAQLHAVGNVIIAPTREK